MGLHVDYSRSAMGHMYNEQEHLLGAYAIMINCVYTSVLITLISVSSLVDYISRSVDILVWCGRHIYSGTCAND